MTYVAILAGAIVIMLLGFVWFHPKVLGKPWMEGAGVSEEELNKFNPLVMIGGILMAIVLSWALSRYASHQDKNLPQFIHGMFHGVMTALLYVAPVLISKGLFERKSIGWILLGAAYWVVAISVASGVVYVLTPAATPA